MQSIVLDVEAGKVSTELARLGIAATVRVNAVVALIEADSEPSISSLADADGGFAWLSQEPDLYTDADLAEPQH